MTPTIARSAVALVVAAALALPLAASAHDRGHHRPTKEQRAKFIKRMKAKRAKLLRTKLGLAEAKAQEVEKVLDAYHAKRRPVHKVMRQHRQTLRNLLKDDSNDQAAYTRVLDGLLKTREQMRQINEAQVQGLKQLLTPKQQAQLMVAHHRMKRRMHRRAWKRGRRGHHGQRGGPQHGGPQHGGPQHGGPGFDGGPGHDGPPPGGPEGEFPPPAGAR